MTRTTPALRLTLATGMSVVLLAVGGLVHTERVHCSRLDPEHPVALSNYFEARGFPFAWLTTANGTCGNLPGVPGRILSSELLRAFAFWAAMTIVGGFLRPRRRLLPAAIRCRS